MTGVSWVSAKNMHVSTKKHALKFGITTAPSLKSTIGGVPSAWGNLAGAPLSISSVDSPTHNIA